MTDYALLYGAMTIPPARLAEVSSQCRAIVANRAQYVAVGMGVPWQWIGAIHWRECGGNFSQHLHNGDPLSARTVDVPAGRPLAGRPPFAWVLSAQDALTLEGLNGLSWDLPTALRRAEAYNGMGYARRGLRSPYVWGATSQQQPGKYIADGVWSATAMDQQVGIAATLFVLAGMGFALGAGQPADNPSTCSKSNDLPIAPVSAPLSADDLNDAEFARVSG